MAPRTEPDRTTFFDVWGPFAVAQEDRGWITTKQADFWEEVENGCDGLSSAIGCYLFCLRTPKRIVPWYAGRTIAQGGFSAECFQPHKRLIYNDVVQNHAGALAQPALFLFPLITPSGRFSTAGKSGKGVIIWLERYLMTAAFARNAEVRNIKDMTYLRQVEVRGILGTSMGRPHDDVRAVRRALFGTTKRPSAQG